MAEPDEIRARYARRATHDPRYSVFDPAALAAHHGRQRAMLRLLQDHGAVDLPSLRLLDVGCGSGGHLLDFLRLGFAPDRLAGIELLPERFVQARARLPLGVALRLGDGADPSVGDFAPASFDIVHQSVVFSSLLDDAFQQGLADRMWSWVRPGGAVLWYDLVVDNPRNADVRGMPLKRIRTLFPQARIDARRLTLAPPIARRVARWSPVVHDVLSAVEPLRTHLLAWIARPG